MIYPQFYSYFNLKDDEDYQEEEKEKEQSDEDKYFKETPAKKPTRGRKRKVEETYVPPVDKERDAEIEKEIALERERQKEREKAKEKEKENETKKKEEEAKNIMNLKPSKQVIKSVAPEDIIHSKATLIGINFKFYYYCYNCFIILYLLY